MRKNLTRIEYWLSKKSSQISSKFIWRALGIIAVALVFIPWLGVWFTCEPFRGISRFFVDVFSPVSLRNIPYAQKVLGETSSSYGWYSSLAYAIGTIFITGLLIAIITNYLRSLGESYRKGMLDRYNWNNHVLFLGYDELMIGTLQNMCKTGMQVVVAVPENVELVRSKIMANLTEVENSQVEVILCNKTDSDDLCKKACVDKVAYLFFIGQPDDPTHDASNLKSLDVAAEILGNDTNVISYIYIRNRASLSLVQRQGFVGEDAMKLRKIVNPFNFYENIAGKLIAGFESGKTLMNIDYHDEKKNLAVCPDAKAHLVILGMTEVGMALAREVLMVAHYPKRRVTITLVDEKAREEMFFFRGRYKELFKNCNYTFEDYDDKEKDPDPSSGDKTLLDVDFEFVQASVAHPKLMKQIETWNKDDKQILTLVICTADSPKNMATALYLPRTLMEGESAIPVWVYQQGDDSLKEFSGHEFYNNVHIFSAKEYSGIDLHDSLEKTWALEVAAAYSRSSGSDSSLKWDEMSHYDRWSSLYNVRSVITKLRGLGYELKKEDNKVTLWNFAEKEKTKCSYLDFDSDTIYKIAETEHIRWMTDTFAKGFRKTTEKEQEEIKKDKSLKNKYKKDCFAHNDLRPYAELDEDTAAYDIDMTEAIISAINRQLRK